MRGDLSDSEHNANSNGSGTNSTARRNTKTRIGNNREQGNRDKEAFGADFIADRNLSSWRLWERIHSAQPAASSQSTLALLHLLRIPLFLLCPHSLSLFPCCSCCVVFVFQVTQDIRVVDGEHEKNRMLYQCLEKVMDGSKVLIFTSTKRMADNLTRMLRQDGWPARAIHGDKSQQERDWVLQEFRTGH